MGVFCRSQDLLPPRWTNTHLSGEGVRAGEAKGGTSCFLPISWGRRLATRYLSHKNVCCFSSALEPHVAHPNQKHSRKGMQPSQAGTFLQSHHTYTTIMPFHPRDFPQRNECVYSPKDIYRHEEPLGCLISMYNLIWMVVTQLYSYVKIHRTIHLRFVPFTIYVCYTFI